LTHPKIKKNPVLALSIPEITKKTIFITPIHRNVTALRCHLGRRTAIPKLKHDVISDGQDASGRVSEGGRRRGHVFLGAVAEPAGRRDTLRDHLDLRFSTWRGV
jgi:hypothetical protein